MFLQNNLPNTSEGKERELSHVYAALECNGYPSKFIRDLQIKKPDHRQIYPLRNLLEYSSI